MERFDHWNYRIIRQHYQVDKQKFTDYGIHEVYYFGGKPVAWTENPKRLVAEEAHEILEDMELMKDAFTKPILSIVDNKLVEIDE